jgi:chromate transport protein ChrA
MKMDPAPQPPSFRETLRVWIKIGLLSFGGPAGQIALMHRELVEKHGWLDEKRFLHALNYCMLLPGPEAQQLAVYAGWLLHKTRGGIVAGALFVLPGALLMWAISYLYVFHGRFRGAAHREKGAQSSGDVGHRRRIPRGHPGFQGAVPADRDHSSVDRFDDGSQADWK